MNSKESRLCLWEMRVQNTRNKKVMDMLFVSFTDTFATFVYHEIECCVHITMLVKWELSDFIVTCILKHFPDNNHDEFSFLWWYNGVALSVDDVTN